MTYRIFLNDPDYELVCGLLDERKRLINEEKELARKLEEVKRQRHNLTSEKIGEKFSISDTYVRNIDLRRES